MGLWGAVKGAALGGAAGGLSPFGPVAGQAGGSILGGYQGWNGANMGFDRTKSAQSFADSEIAGNRNPGALEGQGRRREMLLRGANYVKGREGASAGQSAFRADQRGQINRLTDLAEGRGPSLAQMQAKESLQRGVSAQQALAAGARPGQQAGAARMASQQGSALAGSVAGASAQARAQEQLGALGQLTGAIQGARGQDQGLNLANLQAEMQQRGLNDAQQRAFLEMELRNAGMAQQGALGQAGLRNQVLGFGMQQPTTGERYLSAAEGGLGNIMQGLPFAKGLFPGGGGGSGPAVTNGGAGNPDPRTGGELYNPFG